MSKSRNATEILDREYLELRAKILELAASFDRLQRGDGEVNDDPRMKLLREGLEILASPDDRAEQVQLLFSRPYDDEWQTAYNLSPKHA